MRDDLILCSSCKTLRAETAGRLSEQYPMKDMGPVSTYLGMQLLCDTEGIKLSQSVYISGILTHFGMADSKAVSTPAVDFSGDAPGELRDKTLYRQIVGSLMHLMVVSRPDLAFSVGKLARFMHEPHDVHMIAAKRVLRYLKGHFWICPAISSWGGACPGGIRGRRFRRRYGIKALNFWAVSFPWRFTSGVEESKTVCYCFVDRRSGICFTVSSGKSGLVDASTLL